MNVHEISGGVGLQIRNIPLDFGTDPDLDLGSIFSTFPSLRDTGVKYELKEMRTNIYQNPNQNVNV